MAVGIKIGNKDLIDCYVGTKKVKEIWVNGVCVYPIGDAIVIVAVEVDTIPASGGTVRSCVVKYKVRGNDSVKSKTIEFGEFVSARSLGTNLRETQTLIATKTVVLEAEGEQMNVDVKIYQDKNERHLASKVKTKDDYEVPVNYYHDLRFSSATYSKMSAAGEAAKLTDARYTVEHDITVYCYEATFIETYEWDSRAQEEETVGGNLYDTREEHEILTSGATLSYKLTYAESGRSISINNQGQVTGASRGTTLYSGGKVATVQVEARFEQDEEGVQDVYDYAFVDIYQQENKIESTGNKIYDATDSGVYDPIYENFTASLSYTKATASGISAQPSLSYSIKQTATPWTQKNYHYVNTWTSGATSVTYGKDSVVVGTPSSTTLYGSLGSTDKASLSWSGTIKDSSVNPAINSRGEVTAAYLSTTEKKETLIYVAKVTLSWFGKSIEKTADIYQEANKKSSKWVEVHPSSTSTEYAYKAPVITSFSYGLIPASGGRYPAAVAYSQDKEKISYKTTATEREYFSWTSGASQTGSTRGGVTSETGRSVVSTATTGGTLTFSGYAENSSGATMNSDGEVTGVDLDDTVIEEQNIYYASVYVMLNSKTSATSYFHVRQHYNRIEVNEKKEVAGTAIPESDYKIYENPVITSFSYGTCAASKSSVSPSYSYSCKAANWRKGKNADTYQYTEYTSGYVRTSAVQEGTSWNTQIGDSYDAADECTVAFGYSNAITGADFNTVNGTATAPSCGTLDLPDGRIVLTATLVVITKDGKRETSVVNVTQEANKRRFVNSTAVGLHSVTMLDQFGRDITSSSDNPLTYAEREFYCKVVAEYKDTLKWTSGSVEYGTSYMTTTDATLSVQGSDKQMFTVMSGTVTLSDGVAYKIKMNKNESRLKQRSACIRATFLGVEKDSQTVYQSENTEPLQAASYLRPTRASSTSEWILERTNKPLTESKTIHYSYTVVEGPSLQRKKSGTVFVNASLSEYAIIVTSLEPARVQGIIGYSDY